MNYSNMTGGGGGGTWSAGPVNVTYVSGGTGGSAGGGGGSGTWTPVVPNSAYIRCPSEACRGQGCRAEELEGMLASTLNITQELLARQEKESRMEPTRALWCEQGEHSFSEKDPGLQVMTIQGRDEEGKPVSESRTLCGPCAAKMKVSLRSDRNASVTELPPAD